MYIYIWVCAYTHAAGGAGQSRKGSIGQLMSATRPPDRPSVRPSARLLQPAPPAAYVHIYIYTYGSVSDNVLTLQYPGAKHHVFNLSTSYAFIHIYIHM